MTLLKIDISARMRAGQCPTGAATSILQVRRSGKMVPSIRYRWPPRGDAGLEKRDVVEQTPGAVDAPPTCFATNALASASFNEVWGERVGGVWMEPRQLVMRQNGPLSGGGDGDGGVGVGKAGLRIASVSGRLPRQWGLGTWANGRGMMRSTVRQCSCFPGHPSCNRLRPSFPVEIFDHHHHTIS